jgi:hypothetical protein
VAITYAKDADAASAVVKEIERNGGKAIAIQANAADVDAVKAAVEKTVAALGRLDVLVNNAGTAIPKTFEETTLEEMDRMIDINLRGTLTATQAALKHMKSGGRIIMIGSCVGERVLTPGLVAYSAHEGRREDVYSGAFQGGRDAGHHGEQRPAGPDRHGFESRCGRLGSASEGCHGARPLWERRGGRRLGGVRRRSGVIVYYGGESDGGWRDERLKGRSEI